MKRGRVIILAKKHENNQRKRRYKIGDEFKFMFERREADLKEKLAIREREFDEQLQTLEDQKEKMRLLEEKEKRERQMKKESMKSLSQT